MASLMGGCETSAIIVVVFEVAHFSYASLLQQSWDRVTTPTQTMQQMSMAATPEKTSGSKPYGIEVSKRSISTVVSHFW